ncbi:putative ABC transport system permease protein [Chitinophaga skermanii]|uniref:Putative ABC transport system permease protein n=1 Tax=Chitinophaga skermanii TaxID=331697 RepID=A0A327QHR9_9BACT|nr:ABC transporter permease [Chitinophaga skermanii]RAJ03891.1 putative ABC transport system permease protein [Chitinophaga skermanii]
MITNYIKIAFRNLWKRKSYTFINVTGLAVGVACFALLALFIKHETSYDKFHTNEQNIYRVLTQYNDGAGQVNTYASTASALAGTLKSSSPGILGITRLGDATPVIKAGEQLIQEKKFLYADNDFFKVFSFPTIAGDPAKMLVEPYTLVLSETAARKYFGTTDAVGKMVTINDNQAYKVTGVIKDAPANSQIQYNVIASFNSLEDGRTENWNRPNYQTYVWLDNHVQSKTVETNLNASLSKLMDTWGIKKSDRGILFLLDKFSDVHLHSSIDGLTANMDIRYIYILSIVAILMLLVACINFMNLATARSAERGREIGVRKAIGAKRFQLVSQFLAESGFITLFSVLLGALMAGLALPYFNALAERELSFSLFSVVSIVGILVVLFVVITLLAGIYPALFLSSFRPVTVLKGKMTASGGGLRKTLVIFQFAASVFFILSTIVVIKQLRYIQGSKTGMDRSQVLVIDMPRKLIANFSTFKQQLSTQPGISNVTASYDSPVSTGGGYSINSFEGKGTNLNFSVTALPAEIDFVKTLGMRIITGDDFTMSDEIAAKNEENNVVHFILNETAVKELGLTPALAVGKKLSMNGRNGFVKGVVQDYNFASLKEKITPLVIFTEYGYFGKMMIKTNGDVHKSIASLEKVWHDLVPYAPLEYHFLNDEFDSLYRTERNTGNILIVFSSIIIFISCLGLFGLAAFTAEQRMKEIGIRKVMGATTGSIVALLSKDFLKLVLIAIVIGTPLAWFFMHQWLNNFAYHTKMTADVILMSAITAIVVALGTVGYQAFKAAVINPIRSLKMD